MQLEKTIRLVNNSYSAEVSLSDDGLTGIEKDALAELGDLTIDLGGTFTGSTYAGTYGDLNSISYTLPTNQVSFPSQFPCKQVFSIADHSNAAQRAKLFVETIQTRINTARGTLITAYNATTYIGKTVVTIP